MNINMPKGMNTHDVYCIGRLLDGVHEMSNDNVQYTRYTRICDDNDGANTCLVTRLGVRNILTTHGRPSPKSNGR